MARRDPSTFIYRQEPTVFDPQTGLKLDPNDPANPYSTANWPVDYSLQCGRKNKGCNPNRVTVGGCGYRFTKADNDLQDCPVCGRSRLCRMTRAKGFNVCRMHGAGDARKGKPGGKLTKYRPPEGKGLLEHYRLARNDKKLLEMEELIALLDARLNELLERTDSRDSSEIWGQLEAGYKELTHTWQVMENQLTKFAMALKSGNKANSEAALQELAATIHGGIPAKLAETIDYAKQDWYIWSDILRVVEQRRRVTKSEVETKVALHQMISIERVLAHYDMMYKVITEFVPDPRTQAAIGFAFKERLSNMSPVLELTDGTLILNNEKYTANDGH